MKLQLKNGKRGNEKEIPHRKMNFIIMNYMVKAEQSRNNSINGKYIAEETNLISFQTFHTT